VLRKPSSRCVEYEVPLHGSQSQPFVTLHSRCRGDLLRKGVPRSMKQTMAIHWLFVMSVCLVPAPSHAHMHLWLHTNTYADQRAKCFAGWPAAELANFQLASSHIQTVEQSALPRSSRHRTPHARPHACTEPLRCVQPTPDVLLMQLQEAQGVGLPFEGGDLAASMQRLHVGDEVEFRVTLDRRSGQLKATEVGLRVLSGASTLLLATEA
jgi:hypothetical protein